MSHAHDIDVLNDITKTLIDSHQGYATCVEAVGNHALTKNFQDRADARRDLVNEFQQAVSDLGGTPETGGSVVGAAHRAWTQFTTLFADDEKAAIEAVDDGEEFLAEKIEDKLGDSRLQPATRDLLTRAHQSAREGERFADALDKAL